MVRFFLIFRIHKEEVKCLGDQVFERLTAQVFGASHPFARQVFEYEGLVRYLSTTYYP